MMKRPPARDWRGWFIMATVTSGVRYGLYVVTKVVLSSYYSLDAHLADISALYNAPNIPSNTTTVRAG